MPRGSPTLDSFGDPTHPLIIGLRHKQAYVALGIGVVQQLNTCMREILGTCATYPSSLSPELMETANYCFFSHYVLASWCLRSITVVPTFINLAKAIIELRIVVLLAHLSV